MTFAIHAWFFHKNASSMNSTTPHAQAREVGGLTYVLYLLLSRRSKEGKRPTQKTEKQKFLGRLLPLLLSCYSSKPLGFLSPAPQM